MKRKLIIFCLFTAVLKEGYSQTGSVGPAYSVNYKIETPYADHNNPYKRNSRICGLSGAVLGGGGAMVALFSTVVTSGFRGQDPAELQKTKGYRRTGLIVGGSMMVASIPLFVLAIHYRHQYRKGLALQVQSSPGYDYKGNIASSTNLTLGWRF